MLKKNLFLVVVSIFSVSCEHTWAQCESKAHPNSLVTQKGISRINSTELLKNTNNGETTQQSIQKEELVFLKNLLGKEFRIEPDLCSKYIKYKSLMNEFKNARERYQPKQHVRWTDTKITTELGRPSGKLIELELPDKASRARNALKNIVGSKRMEKIDNHLKISKETAHFIETGKWPDTLIGF